MQSPWLKSTNIIKKGGVVVIPTDTLFGVVASAFDKDAIERIYKLKGRDTSKPFIILISVLKDLEKFGVNLNPEQKEFLNKIWPGKVSVILPCKDSKLKYLHRGTKSLAFRMIGPKNKNLFNLINKTGPIVAPSANPEGLIPARNISKAKDYFSDSVDVYVPGVIRSTKPSTLIEYKNGEIIIIRQGAVKI